MKVSILIHNLNRASLLQSCLASVLRQSYRPLEAVVLDAGSTDCSWAVIQEAIRQFHESGIELRAERCALMGVAASRNWAAHLATGSLLCVIDNDAAFEAPDCVARAVKQFESNVHLGLVSFRILKGDTGECDRTAWVFRRPCDVWFGREFPTFTFAGGAFCVRADAFQEVGGFWDHLEYSREEEELAMALIDRGWSIEYSPTTAIRHYSDSRGRLSSGQRRYVELRNGILVLWRRLPVPLAILAIGARIGSMSAKAVLRREYGLGELLPAVLEAVRDWRQHRLKRAPIGVRSTYKYALLHFAR